MNIRIDRRRSLRLALALSLTLPVLGPIPASARDSTPFSAINAAAKAGPINVHSLRGGISMLDGSGGNITVLSGPDGFFLVDTGIAVSQAMILEALRSIGPGKIRLAVDTHWHWDHADGNGWVRAQGASILADPAAIKRLEETIRVVEWGNTFRPKPAEPDLNLVQNGTGGTTLIGDLNTPSLTLASGTFGFGANRIATLSASVASTGGVVDFGTATTVNFTGSVDPPSSEVRYA